MAFADWESSVTGATVVQWDSIDPIQGSHSWVAVGASGDYLSGWTSGVTNACGRIRVLHKEVDSAASDHPNVTKWFIYGMMQTSFNFGSSAYCLGYDSESPNVLTLYKTSPTSAMASGGIVANGTYGGAQMTRPFVYAMQLNWQTDPISGNVLLIGSFDGPIADPNTYDYSTLVDVVTYTDGSTPYTVGVTAGWFGHSAGATRKNYYDWVDIFTD